MSIDPYNKEKGLDDNEQTLSFLVVRSCGVRWIKHETPRRV